MATTKLSDTMITTMLGALRHRNNEGRYEIIGGARRTVDSLISRGKAEAVEIVLIRETATGKPVSTRMATYLTEEGVTFLREALTYILGKRGDERDAVWQDWLTAERRNEWALIDFLGLTADTYEVATTTPHERGTQRETLGRADAWEQMGNALRNGQRITIDARTMTVHTKMGARWTFTCTEKEPTPVTAEDVEDVDYRMFVGVLFEDAKDMGTYKAANVRAAIKNNADQGHRAVRTEDGMIHVYYSWFVPQRPGAEESPAAPAEELDRMGRPHIAIAPKPGEDSVSHLSAGSALTRGLPLNMLAHPAVEEQPGAPVAINPQERPPLAERVTVGDLNVGDEFVTRCGWTVLAIDGGTFTAERYDGGQTVTQTVPESTEVLRTRRAPQVRGVVPSPHGVGTAVVLAPRSVGDTEPWADAADTRYGARYEETEVEREA
ncbi:hypothetical protein FNV58_01030 (plasmid) [Streptomyces sp. RLB1-9]|uniref:hypothetical protein n=1 Tax=Streptomyces sp. RLB1-9 TaxID=2594454 RepID=UPI0011641829|nr:hypothetical protein [Streptomyces sp. RLB1-9]QDN94944.1 hypothetical protein FNV58_01030 [Streptomyces sp. RLB1-9]